jgi:hypothetical protein
VGWYFETIPRHSQQLAERNLEPLIFAQSVGLGFPELPQFPNAQVNLLGRIAFSLVQTVAHRALTH